MASARDPIAITTPLKGAAKLSGAVFCSSAVDTPDAVADTVEEVFVGSAPAFTVLLTVLPVIWGGKRVSSSVAVIWPFGPSSMITSNVACGARETINV